MPTFNVPGLGVNATSQPSAFGPTTVTTLQTSGIAGFGQAPEANNAVAARSATSDNTSNIFLGRNAAGVVKAAIDGTGFGSLLGGLVVGTDPGGTETERISGSIRVSAGYKSTSGQTGAIGNGASQGVFVPTIASCAVLLFMQGTVNTATYAVVLAHVDAAGNMSQMTVLASASLTPTIGSSIISVTNNSGVSQGVNWSATYFGV